MEMKLAVVLENQAVEVTIPEEAIIEAARQTFARFQNNGGDVMREGAFARGVIEAMGDPALGRAMTVRSLSALPTNDA